MPRLKIDTPTQKKQLEADFQKGWKGSAIDYYLETQRDPYRLTVAPSSFKRLIHEARREHGSHYILDERVSGSNPQGTPFCQYFMHPEIRSQNAVEGPVITQHDDLPTP